MGFAATCDCGATFQLKDDFLGQLLQCPNCQRSFTAQPAAPIARAAQADPAFERDRFLLRQKVIAINEKYDVMDENNQPIVFVERPARLFRNLGALLVGLLVLALFVGGTIALVIFLWPNGMNHNQGVAAGALVLSALVVGIVAALTVGILLSAKRHVTFYRNATRGEKLLEIIQDSKFQPINATYTIRDPQGQVLGTLRKNILYNFIRKRWYCCAADGSLAYVAREDSIILSLLRRLLGSMLGLLRTNFIIQPAGSEDVIGEFNRKLTLFDRYVLDLRADPSRLLDRRVALAMGVMLDTGERR